MFVGWDIFSKPLLGMSFSKHLVHGDLVRLFNLLMARALLGNQMKHSNIIIKIVTLYLI
jgi:hypothetical protein